MGVFSYYWNNVSFVLCVLQVYSLEDGPVHAVWRKIGFSVTVLQISNKSAVAIDWLK